MLLILFMTDNPPTSRKHRHNLKVRNRILLGAGEAFRRRGYADVSVNDLMASADLTRGAFYAHFASKEELYLAIIPDDRALLPLLKGRGDTAPDSLLLGMRHIFREYLSLDHQHAIQGGCSLAMCATEISRGTEEMQSAYQALRSAVLEEMARGTRSTPDDTRLNAALTLATGAVATASALPDGPAHAAVLGDAAMGVDALFQDLRPA